MADSGERTPDDNSKEERWLEDINRNVTKKQTVRRNLEADYNAVVHTESFKELPRKPTVRKLEFDSYALPLTCPMCKKPYSDPVVTRCSHYFCRHCALEHHEKDNKCFVCKQPTLGVFNTAVEIKQKIAQLRGKAKAMLKEASETMEKASVIMNEAETMKAESAEMVEEVERLVEIAETYGPNLLADPMWDTVVNMVSNMEDITAQAKDMAEKAAAMMQEANATVEKGKGEMAKALAMIKNVKWSV